MDCTTQFVRKLKEYTLWVDWRNRSLVNKKAAASRRNTHHTNRFHQITPMLRLRRGATSGDSK